MEPTEPKAPWTPEGFKMLNQLIERIVREALEDLVERESKGDK